MADRDQTTTDELIEMLDRCNSDWYSGNQEAFSVEELQALRGAIERLRVIEEGRAVGPATACPYCGMRHGPRCPSVEAIEYYPDGTVKRVEFVKPQPIIGMDPDILRKGPMA